MKRILITAMVCLALVSGSVPVSAQSDGDTVTVDVHVYNESGVQVADLNFTDDSGIFNDAYGFSTNHRDATDVETGFYDYLRFDNGTVIESFEDGDISEYQADTGEFGASDIGSTDGNYFLIGYSDGTNHFIHRSDTDHPDPGDTFSVDMRIEDNARQGFFFSANQSTADTSLHNEPNSYIVYLEYEDSDILAGKQDGGNVVISDKQNHNLQQHEWYTVEMNWQVVGSELSGNVTGPGGSALDNARVVAVDSNGNEDGNVTTNANGAYSMSLANGTYDVTASKSSYQDQTKTVTIDGSNETQDFKLSLAGETDLEIDTRHYLEHNTSAPYHIIHNDSSGDRSDVTDNATLTSANTTIVTVNSTSQTINATADTAVNGRTFLTANYTTSSGDELQATQNITVANETVENVDILPTWQRVSASLQDTTIQTLIVATMVGSAAAIFASCFAGIAAWTMVMTVGWLAGRIDDGMIMVCWMIGVFVALNVALNIDTSVR